MATNMSTDTGQRPSGQVSGQGWTRRQVGGGGTLIVPMPAGPDEVSATPSTDPPDSLSVDRPAAPAAGVRGWLVDTLSAVSTWLVDLGWLAVSAGLLTFICLGCALVDSYTSLCVVGGSLGHIGQASACPDFGGWDTRVFPLAVDAGWGGALFALLRLARAIGMKSWRYWVVLGFELLTAAVTITGNAFHGLVLDGGTSQFPGAANLVIGAVASAVPGVVAVGSGFTLSVLVSNGRLAKVPGAVQDQPSTVSIERVPNTWVGVQSPDGQWWWDGAQWCPVPASSSRPVTGADMGPERLADSRPVSSSEPSVDADGDQDGARRERVLAYLRGQVSAGRDPLTVPVTELARETDISRSALYRGRLLPKHLSADLSAARTGVAA